MLYISTPLLIDFVTGHMYLLISLICVPHSTTPKSFGTPCFFTESVCLFMFLFCLFIWFLFWEDNLEKEMASHSSILTWRISWTEELGGPQSMGFG